MDSQIRKLLDRAKANEYNKLADVPRWRTLRYWQEMAVYFWLCSIIGHYIETSWAWIQETLTHRVVWHPIMPSFLPIAVPYGFGIVAILIFVVPLIKKYKPNLVVAYLLCSVFCGLVEYLCAALIVMVNGSNKYWSYAHQQFNFNGYTSVEASATFGVFAFLFLFFIYPFCEKHLKRVSAKHLNIFFWAMIIIYGLDLTISGFFK